MPDHIGLPVEGYRPQNEYAVQRVNANKRHEEEILRTLDAMKTNPSVDQRWLEIGRTHLEEGFMAVNRSIFRPGRVTLPGDVNKGD